MGSLGNLSLDTILAALKSLLSTGSSTHPKTN